MKIKNILLFLLINIILTTNSAYSCSSVDTPLRTEYQLINGETVYAYIIDDPYIVFPDDTKIAQLENGYRALIIETLSDVEYHKLKPALTSNTKKQILNKNNEYNPLYFTDGSHIFWKGKTIVNPNDQPAVDVKTFKQSFPHREYASDKNSIYYEGKRTDDNLKESPLNLQQLDIVNEEAYDSTNTNYHPLVSDGNNLYHMGKQLGTAQNYRLIKSHTYFVCGYKIYDAIEANKDHIFINGEVLKNADADTFKIKRWMPDEKFLNYTDKNGEHIYTYDSPVKVAESRLKNIIPSKNRGFLLTRDKVFYAEQEIQGLNPENIKLFRYHNLIQDEETSIIYLVRDHKKSEIEKIKPIDFRNTEYPEYTTDKIIIIGKDSVYISYPGLPIHIEKFQKSNE